MRINHFQCPSSQEHSQVTLFESQQNIVTKDDVYDGPASDIVITIKLTESDYYVNDFEIIYNDDESKTISSQAPKRSKDRSEFLQIFILTSLYLLARKL